MPQHRDPFSLALEDLRDRVTRGVYAPGHPVVIHEEARRLGLSTTPVREALAWLCGEGLMERARRAGFVAPRLDAALLRDRFWVRLCCVETSLELTETLGSSVVSGSDPSDQCLVWEMFDRLVRATGNRAVIEVFGRIDAQLRMLGDAEAYVFPDATEEAREMAHVEHTGSRNQLLDAIKAYHQRRIENAALIVLQVERRADRWAVKG